MVRVRHGALLLLAGVQASAQSFTMGRSVSQGTPTYMPTGVWPAATKAESNAAWPSGHQPQRLEEWPQTNFGTTNASLENCWKTTILHDTVNGWPGVCLRLFKAEGIEDELNCKTLCSKDARCPVWQFNNQSNPGQCWVGYGTNCALRRGSTNYISVQRAQRLMHGEVRVLKNMSGVKIHGLFHIGTFAAGDEDLSVERCKAWCYSSIGCDYWQYSVSGGCYVDAPLWSTDKNQHPSIQVQYPLTTGAGGATPDPSMTYGEYIQHYCPPYSDTPVIAADVVSTSAAPSDDGDSWMSGWGVWALAALLSLLGVLFCLYYFMMQGQDNGGSKRSKGRKEAFSDDSYFQDEGKPLMKSGRRAMPYDNTTPSEDRFPPPPQPPATMNSMPPQAQGQMPPPTQLVDMGSQQVPGHPGYQMPMTQQAVRGHPAPQLMQQGMPFPRPAPYAGPTPRMM